MERLFSMLYVDGMGLVIIGRFRRAPSVQIRLLTSTLNTEVWQDLENMWSINQPDIKVYYAAIWMKEKFWIYLKRYSGYIFEWRDQMMFWFWAQTYQIICAVEGKYVFPFPLAGQNKETFQRNSFWDTARLLICFSLLQTWRGQASTLNFRKASLKIIHKHLECKYPTMYTSSPLNNTFPKRWIRNKAQIILT